MFPEADTADAKAAPDNHALNSITAADDKIGSSNALDHQHVQLGGKIGRNLSRISHRRDLLKFQTPPMGRRNEQCVLKKSPFLYISLHFEVCGHGTTYAAVSRNALDLSFIDSVDRDLDGLSRLIFRSET